MRKEMLLWVTPLPWPVILQCAVALPFPRRRPCTWLIPLFWDNVYTQDSVWSGATEAEFPFQHAPMVAFEKNCLPWHDKVPQGSASSFDFDTWVSAARRNCPHSGFRACLASQNGKKLNYFLDCWEESQESSRAMEKGEDMGREGCGTSNVGLQP